jgi:hypothetical protein
MNEEADSDVQVELAALQQRLGKLEAEHRKLLRRATRTRRPASSRKFLLSALPVALMLAAGGVLYAVNALFIDKEGNATFNKRLNFQSSGDGDQMINLYLQQHGIGVQNSTTYFRSVADFAWFAGGKHSRDRLAAGDGGRVLMALTGDNLGIGTASPSAKLDVAGTLNVADVATFQKDATINGRIAPSSPSSRLWPSL